MARHVFIDNSNIYGVAQRVAESRDVWEHWTSIRIHYKSLFDLPVIQLSDGGCSV